MNISNGVAAHRVFTDMPKAGTSKDKEYRVRQDQREIADRFERSRGLGNAVAGAISGALIETVDAAVKSPVLAVKVIYDTARAETLGPNIKILSALAALPAAALSVVAAPLYGVVHGMSTMRGAHKEMKDVLPKDASAEYVHKRFYGEKSMSSKLMQGLDELGDRKLEPGAKKYDVPILSPLFAVVGATASAAISGSVGLVAGLAAGLLTTGKEIVGGIKELKPGRVLAAPLHTVAIPYGLVKEGLKESVPRGLADGWKHGPIKPIVDTTKASVTIAAGVLKEAWER